MPARGLCTAHVSLAVGGSFWVFVLLFSVYFCSGFRLNRFERPGQSVGQSIRRSVRKHAGLSDSRAVGRLVHSPFAERQAVSQSVRQCLIYLMSRNRQMRCMFKILGEPESPHEGGGMFKIYGEPESPDEATCFINKYINKNIYIYIYIYICYPPPLRPHVQQKRSIIHGSDCTCTILKLNISSAPQQIPDRVFLLED